MSKNLIYFAILLALFYGVKPCFAADTAIPSDESIEDSFKLLDESTNKSNKPTEMNTHSELNFDDQTGVAGEAKSSKPPEQKKNSKSD